MELNVSMFDSDSNLFYKRMLRTLTQTIGDKLMFESTLLKNRSFSFAFTKSALLYLLTILLVNKVLYLRAYVSQMGTISFWSSKHVLLFSIMAYLIKVYLELINA